MFHLVNAGVLIDCDISKLTEQDYQDINEIYLDKLLIAFVNQPFESVPFAKLIQKMGSFANWEQMLWKQDGTSIGKQAYTDPLSALYVFLNITCLMPL